MGNTRVVEKERISHNLKEQRDSVAQVQYFANFHHELYYIFHKKTDCVLYRETEVVRNSPE